MDIKLTVELPPDAENRLLAESPDIPQAVREGFLVNLYRRGMLTHAELAKASRPSAASRLTHCETATWLGSKGAYSTRWRVILEARSVLNERGSLPNVYHWSGERGTAS